MSYKYNEIQVMDYVHGEMGESERQAFEAALKEDANLFAEVKEMQAMVHWMKETPEKEVIPPNPSFLNGNKPVHTQEKSVLLLPWMYKLMAVAASVVMVVLALGLLDVRVQLKDNTMAISVGPIENQTAQPSENLSPAEVEAMIQVAMSKENTYHAQEIAFLKEELNNTVAVLEQSTNKRMASITNRPQATPEIPQEIIDGFISEMKVENVNMLQHLFEESEANQRTFTKELVADFADYLEQKRIEDLRTIENNMNRVLINSELKQLETDQVLASLMSNLGNNNEQLQND